LPNFETLVPGNERTVPCHNALDPRLLLTAMTGPPLSAEALLQLCSNYTPLVVEVWEDRASAAAAPPLLDNRVFCPVISSRVCHVLCYYQGAVKWTMLGR
jgi:hypothetical protein